MNVKKMSKLKTVKVARNALNKAMEVSCTCGGFVLQYEGCRCERKVKISQAESNLKDAIDAI